MKNSLFKRAVAAVATVPLALTQCLTCTSFAASTDAVKVTGDAIKAEASADTSVTLDNMLYIAPDDADQKSDWNLTLSSALDKIVSNGNTTGTLDITGFANALASRAGQYSDLAKAMFAQVEGVAYRVTDDGDILVAAKVNNLAAALQSDVNKALGKRVKELADKYNAPELANIDFAKVDISGIVEVTIKTSELAGGTKFTVDVAFAAEDGKTYTVYDAINTYAAGKLAEQIDADELIILTSVEKVCLNHGKEDEEELDTISVEQAKQYMDEGHFGIYNMLPKFQASVGFIEKKEGRSALITSFDTLKDALKGKTGTVIE